MIWRSAVSTVKEVRRRASTPATRAGSTRTRAAPRAKSRWTSSRRAGDSAAPPRHGAGRRRFGRRSAVSLPRRRRIARTAGRSRRASGLGAVESARRRSASRHRRHGVAKFRIDTVCSSGIFSHSSDAHLEELQLQQHRHRRAPPHRVVDPRRGRPDADAAALASLSRFFPSGVSLASSSMASARSPPPSRPVIPPRSTPLHHGHDLEPRPVAAATNLGAPVAAELKRERHDELDFLPRHRVVRGRGLHHRRDPSRRREGDSLRTPRTTRAASCASPRADPQFQFRLVHGSGVRPPRFPAGTVGDDSASTASAPVLTTTDRGRGGLVRTRTARGEVARVRAR